MKKIPLLLGLAIVCSGLWRCESFLDETPNKSGSAYIYHMDQLEGLLGDYRLYRGGSCWNELLFLGDGVEYTPYYTVAAKATGNYYNAWNWNDSYYETGRLTSMTWEPCWKSIFTFNTVLENMDNVIQTTASIRKQVEGEALFGRAYFHFIALVQYALWNEDEPGIGYRTSTAAGDIPNRETVGYTLERIYKDLTDAETLLTEAGRTAFEPKRNFRPTVPTVKALRARIDLYRGNYTDALANANAALKGYDYLLDFKNAPLYKVSEIGHINVLDQTNSVVVKQLPYKGMAELTTQGRVDGNGGNTVSGHPEFFLPQTSSLYFAANEQVPISEYIFNLFDRENDERWLRFYDNNYMLFNGNLSRSIVLPGDDTATPNCFTWEDQQGLKEVNNHAYMRFCTSGAGKHYVIGLTTAEMYLIKAECLARSGQAATAAEVLKTLRRTRFTTQAAADDIGGSLQEVLDERTREMGELWRFFDIKRLNGAENAGIPVRRTIVTDFTDANATQTYEISPDDPRWALPIDPAQLLLMRWTQNRKH